MNLIDTGPSSAGWHQLETIMRCPRLFGLLKCGAVSIKAMPLIRGSLVHVGLAHHFSLLKDPTADLYQPIEAMQVYAEKMNALDLLPQTVRVFEAFRETNRIRGEIVSVEQEYETQIPNMMNPDKPFKYTARFDLVIRDRTGKYWIYDHKTCSRMDDRVSNRYSLSGQILGLRYLGCKIFKGDFGGLKINLIQVTDPIKFREISPEHASHAFLKFEQTVNWAHTLLDFFDRSNLEPSNYPAVDSEQTCETIYGSCPGQGFCKLGPVAWSLMH